VEVDALTGWSFSLEEVSAGVYRGMGVDEAGRSVEMSGTDPDAVLEDCRRAVLALIEGA
jgi:hypothetical protein